MASTKRYQARPLNKMKYYCWKKWVVALILFLFPQTSRALEATDRLRIDGFVTQGYLRTTENTFLDADSHGTLNFNSYNLMMKADVTEQFSVWSKLFTSSDRDDSITLDWAFGEYAFNPFVHLKIGKIPMPVGIYNEIRDIFPVLLLALLPTLYAEWNEFSPEALKGLNIGGHASKKGWGFSYDLFAGRTLALHEGEETPWENIGGLRVWLKTPVEGLRFGGTYFQGIESQEGEQVDTSAALASADYQAPFGLTLRGEWGKHAENGRFKKTAIGYYIEAAYLLDERWLPVIRYDSFFPQRGERSEIEDFHKAWAIGLTYRFTDYLIGKVEGHFIHGAALLSPVENPIPEGRWRLIAAQVSFLF